MGFEGRRLQKEKSVPLTKHEQDIIDLKRQLETAKRINPQDVAEIEEALEKKIREG